MTKKHDPELLDLVRVLRRGGHLLSQSLWEYRPTNEANLLSERNLSLHLALAFHEAGFRCFAEGQWADRRDHHIDLVALHPYRRLLALVECKRLFRAEGCQALLADLERIVNFEPRYESKHDPSNVGEFARYGVIVANTWEGPIAKWWSTEDGRWPADEGDVWQEFEKHPALSNASWGSVQIEGMHEGWACPTDDRSVQYLLYVVFPLSR